MARIGTQSPHIFPESACGVCKSEVRSIWTKY